MAGSEENTPKCREGEIDLDLHLIGGFRECGHILYHKTGEKNGQRRILIQILAHGSLTQRQLGQIMNLSSGAMSEIMAKMEAYGLVKRVKGLRDKRQMELTLTEFGRESAIELLAEDKRLSQQLFSCLTEDEKEQLAATLRKLLERWIVMTAQPETDGKEKKGETNKHD